MSTAFPALGTTAEVLVTDPARLSAAAELLHEELAAIDLACSRFRADSEISRLHEQAGKQVRVGALLAEALGVALRAARVSDGLVDPTVGSAVRELGYDRDFAEVAASAPDDGDSAATGQAPGPGSHAAARPDLTAAVKATLRASDARKVALTAFQVSRGGPYVVAPPGEPTTVPPVPAPGWHRVLFDPVQRLVVLPRGIRLDLGATAKALAADRAARRIHSVVGCGALVNLGGDLRAAGRGPDGGWQVALGDDHAGAVDRPDATVALHRDFALATSGTTRRRWRRGGRTVHHIVDPRTGDVPEARWRTVTVAAKSTVDANTAATAAIVLGSSAPDWLARRRLPARLVGVGGDVVTTAGWPS
ncbi:FAD:protein FMN transferase [Amycolatopsis eburnea]|uniref:FAD:protein FMN transferase n=1 Tax=Amycolatopsis eburnea TaxID=2267691 RepID=A0A3R9FIZ4_9PSEU|nr:FAD:protein FMN transferase [Amycolatopsis eburnea]RSD12060.1 FAD:protein FMN transferase [Amycolatopsis eburnea]